jgi:hypothetical protein
MRMRSSQFFFSIITARGQVQRMLGVIAATSFFSSLAARKPFLRLCRLVWQVSGLFCIVGFSENWQH